MSNTITKHQETFKIRASEVGAGEQLTLPALCGLFQEIAGNHALKLNFDITQLHQQNLTWVLHRMDIQVDRYPNWRETITIETWPAAGDSLRAYRNYLVLDEDGKEIVRSLSYWMMINLETRRPTRMPQEVLDLRLAELDHVMPVKTSRLKPFKNPDKETEIHVRKSDLDMNRHVNNTRFVEWMMETYADDKASAVKAMDITFLRESVAGDEISSQMKKQANTVLHQLEKQDGETIALAECVF